MKENKKNVSSIGMLVSSLLDKLGRNIYAFGITLILIGVLVLNWYISTVVRLKIENLENKLKKMTDHAIENNHARYEKTLKSRTLTTETYELKFVWNDPYTNYVHESLCRMMNDRYEDVIGRLEGIEVDWQKLYANVPIITRASYDGGNHAVYCLAIDRNRDLFIASDGSYRGMGCEVITHTIGGKKYNPPITNCWVYTKRSRLYNYNWEYETLEEMVFYTMSHELAVARRKEIGGICSDIASIDVPNAWDVSESDILKCAEHSASLLNKVWSGCRIVLEDVERMEVGDFEKTKNYFINFHIDSSVSD